MTDFGTLTTYIKCPNCNQMINEIAQWSKTYGFLKEYFWSCYNCWEKENKK